MIMHVEIIRRGMEYVWTMPSFIWEATTLFGKPGMRSGPHDAGLFWLYFSSTCFALLRRVMRRQTLFFSY